MRLLTFIFILFLGWLPVLGQNSTYWYVDNLPDVWFYQPDVFAFKCLNGSAFTGTLDTTVIDSIVHRANRSDKAVEVFFKPTATPTQILDQIQDIWNSGQLEMPYLTLTKDPAQPRTAEQWFTFDNILLVSFNDPYPSTSDLNNFMGALNLTPCNFPDPNLPTLTQGPSYVYSFYMIPDPDGPAAYSADYFTAIAREAFTSFNGLVANAVPNITNHRRSPRPVGATNVSSPTGTMTSCATNDPLYEVYNHIENTGTTANIPLPSAIPSGFLPLGTAGADAHICDCWNQGLSGAGVKIAVVGFDPFYTEDPDMQSVFDYNRMWDCSGTQCLAAYNQWNIPSWQTYLFEPARAIAYFIGADGGNSIGGVGVAPNTTIFSYMVGTSGAPVTGSNVGQFSTISAVYAIQQALSDGADILVLDLWMSVDDPAIKTSIMQFNANARPPYRGITIATSGIDPDYTGSSSSLYSASTKWYPASLPQSAHDPEVIGVIASNRHDLKTDWELPLWQPVYTMPSNYGHQYDVAAPGVALPYSSAYTAGNPSSFQVSYAVSPELGSLATTAGVCAMIMEFAPTLTGPQITNALFQSTDPVGGYSYNYSTLLGNKSDELGYGRINCGNAINMIQQTSLINTTLLNQDLSVKYEYEYWEVHTEKQKKVSTASLQLALSNIQGKVIENYELDTEGKVFIPNKNLAQGVYILNIANKEGQHIHSIKLLKY